MPRNRRELCPAGIEDRCPIPRYRCREAGEPGKHCMELLREFEMFVLPDKEATRTDASAADDTQDQAANEEGDAWTA